MKSMSQYDEDTVRWGGAACQAEDYTQSDKQKKEINKTPNSCQKEPWQSKKEL